ncbi:MAG: hypothetical protein AAF598_20415 [Bacteroidota bacterium]
MRSINRAKFTPESDVQDAFADALVKARQAASKSSSYRLISGLYRWNWILLSIVFTVFIALGLFGILFPSSIINILLIVLLGLAIIVFLIGRDIRIPMNQYEVQQAFKQPILQVMVTHFFDRAAYYSDKGFQKTYLEWLDLFGHDIDNIFAEDLIEGQWKGRDFMCAEVFLFKDIFPVLRWADKSAAFMQGLAFILPYRDERMPNFHICPVELPVSKQLNKQMAHSTVEQDYLLFFEDRWYSREVPLLNALRTFNTDRNTTLLIGKSNRGIYAFLPLQKEAFELPENDENAPGLSPNILDELRFQNRTERDRFEGLIQELIECQLVLDLLLSLPEIT